MISTLLGMAVVAATQMPTDLPPLNVMHEQVQAPATEMLVYHKRGRFEKFGDKCILWWDTHPKTVRWLRFTGRSCLFTLNCASAVGNIVRW